MSSQRRRSRRPTVVVFCMPAWGHFRRCRAVVHALATAGLDVVVFTHRRFAAETEAVGGRFVNLFAGRPLAAADDTSWPVLCRWVTFAGRHAAEIVEQVRALDPQLVIGDAAAVIDRVVAQALGLPHVAVSVGHNLRAQEWLPRLIESSVPRVSDACLAAVEQLRDRWGLADASPFCFFAPPSPTLNLHCEPPEFLPESARAAFEPLAFVGSILDPASTASAAATAAASPRAPVRPLFDPAAPLKVYVSLGTFTWLQWEAECVEAMRAITRDLAAMPGVDALCAFRGVAFQPELRAELTAANVRVVPHVDQWRALAQANAFITHNGLNSTHEAIFHRVPMVSYPIDADQPELAELCRELDLAVGIGTSPAGPLAPGAVAAALGQIRDELPRLQAGLTTARAWEDAVIAGRPAVARRLAAIAGDD